MLGKKKKQTPWNLTTFERNVLQRHRVYMVSFVYTQSKPISSVKERQKHESVQLTIWTSRFILIRVIWAEGAFEPLDGALLVLGHARHPIIEGAGREPQRHDGSRAASYRSRLTLLINLSREKTQKHRRFRLSFEQIGFRILGGVGTACWELWQVLINKIGSHEAFWAEERSKRCGFK